MERSDWANRGESDDVKEGRPLIELALEAMHEYINPIRLEQARTLALISIAESLERIADNKDETSSA